MLSFKYKNTPTLDIYFREPLKNLIFERGMWPSSYPIRRLGPNSFIANNRLVIIRYITGKELRKLKSLHWERCYYLIDDDFNIITNDKSIPADYRQRLLRFSNEMLPEILYMADTIIAPNPLIHRAYTGKKHLLLNPAYNSLCQDFSHFEQKSTVDILFSGTRSHLNDLLFVSDVMVDICRRYHNVRFTTFMGEYAPDSLKGIENIINRKARSWEKFRTNMQNERYHICLAPYQDTPFNNARSINKILDHAAFGAAGVYSARPPLSECIKHDRDGLLIDDRPKNWYGAIEGLVTDMKVAKRLAESGCSLAARLGKPSNVRDFWLKILSIPLP